MLHIDLHEASGSLAWHVPTVSLTCMFCGFTRPIAAKAQTGLSLQNLLQNRTLGRKSCFFPRPAAGLLVPFSTSETKAERENAT